MYTILRFTRDSVDEKLFDNIGQMLNGIIPGAYVGLRKAGDGFACDVSDSDSWSDHKQAIIAILDAATDPIKQAIKNGIDVCFDVAIEPEDIIGTNVVSLNQDQSLIASLYKLGVEFELSIYGPHK